MVPAPGHLHPENVYEPTKVALEHLVPRMPKGAILFFDELNDGSWPGETAAVMETVGISNLRIQRLPFDASVALLPARLELHRHRLCEVGH